MFYGVPLAMAMFSDPNNLNDYWFETCTAADSEWEDRETEPQFEIMEC